MSRIPVHKFHNHWCRWWPSPQGLWLASRPSSAHPGTLSWQYSVNFIHTEYIKLIGWYSCSLLCWMMMSVNLCLHRSEGGGEGLALTLVEDRYVLVTLAWTKHICWNLAGIFVNICKIWQHVNSVCAGLDTLPKHTEWWGRGQDTGVTLFATKPISSLCHHHQLWCHASDNFC